MKKTLLSIALVTAATLGATAANAAPNSYQLGTVTELVVGPGGASFQLDTSADNIDIRSDCNDAGAPLNFTIDTTTIAGAKMFDLVLDAKKGGYKLGVNGDGVCVGTEAEKADSIAPSF